MSGVEAGIIGFLVMVALMLIGLPIAAVMLLLGLVGGILAFKSVGNVARPVVYLTGVDNAKFRKPVIPGDQLRLEVEVVKKRAPFWKMQGKAFVDTELVCEADVTAMVTEEKGGDVNR